MKFFKLPLAGIISFILWMPCFGQLTLKTGDTTYNNWRYAVVHIESVYQRPGKLLIRDTLNGTAFFLADNNKIYLVTAKHIVKAALYKKNEKLIIDSLYINTVLDRKGLNITHLSSQNNSIIFTDDEEDIAIISLQNNNGILNYMLKSHCRPLSIKLFDTTAIHYPDEKVLISSSSTFTFLGKKNITFGFSLGKVKSYDQAHKSFIVTYSALQGENGAPVMAGNQLVGILSYQSGLQGNKDIINHPYFVAKSINVVKTAYILTALRKLQKEE